MITKSQFCTNLISEFIKPAGIINTKEQSSIEPNRKLLNAFINKGFKINDESKIEIYLEGVVSSSNNNLFNQDCFDFNCFNDDGISTYVNNISNICLVNTTPSKFLTLEERLDLNLSCYLNQQNKATYFVRGSNDIYNNVYVADIGIVNPITGNINIKEFNTPFYSINKTTVAALSLEKFPVGIKAAIIKKVNLNSVETIGIVYGQLTNNFYFPHNDLKTVRLYNNNDQQIDLENLSLNLLIVNNLKRFEVLNNQQIFRSNYYSSSKFESILKNSASTLISLINSVDEKYIGSIPKYINSFSNNENEYNSLADNNYLNTIEKCFEENCFELDCFEEITNNTLINRSISNKALAWCTYFLSSYVVNYSKPLNEITLIGSFLLNQKDKNSKLYYEGYNQNPLENSYKTSLVLNTTISYSTNVSIFIALLKLFEVTQNFNYLIEADELLNAIKKYLINDKNLAKHSFTNNNTSIESITYQLLLHLIIEDYEPIPNILSFLEQRLKAPQLETLEDVQVGADTVLINTDIVQILNTNLFTSDEDYNLFTNTSFDNINTPQDIFKYNYLIYSNLKYLSEKIYVPFLNTIQDKYKLIEEKLEVERENSTLIYVLSCLNNNTSILNTDNLKFNCINTFNNYRFQKTYIYNSLIINTPKDYGWFNPNVFNNNSHIGMIYYSTAKVLALTSARYEYIKNVNTVDNMYGILLNKKALDYNLTRFEKEEDTFLKQRIKSEIFARGVNKLSIENRLNLYESIPIIKDNYLATLASESNNNIYSNNWGEGYLSGQDINNTNIVTLNFSQPVEKDVYEELLKIKPAGIKINIIENLTFTIKKNNTYINIFEESNNFNSITTENNIDLITEDIINITVEDS